MRMTVWSSPKSSRPTAQECPPRDMSRLRRHSALLQAFAVIPKTRGQVELICVNAHMRIYLYKRAMHEILSILSALAEPTRLSAIRLLWDGDEHCVCELMKKIDASQSRMSRHMASLKAAGLVVDRREAQWVRYRRNPALSPEIVEIVDAVMAALPLSDRKAA